MLVRSMTSVRTDSGAVRATQRSRVSRIRNALKPSCAPRRAIMLCDRLEGCCERQNGEADLAELKMGIAVREIILPPARRSKGETNHRVLAHAPRPVLERPILAHESLGL
jgi:hypothetical protein